MSNNNEKPNEKKEDVDQFFESLQDLKGNVMTMSKVLFNMTSDSLNEVNVRAKEFGDQWKSEVEKFKEENRHHREKCWRRRRENKDGDSPLVYETRDAFGAWSKDPVAVGEPLETLFPKSVPWEFDDTFFRGPFRNQRSPFGYYSLRNPSIRQYNDCLTKEGESLWDSHGHWRCLFPNREVPAEYLSYKDKVLPNKILTKEDFNDAVGERGIDTSGPIDLGDRGVFFKQYEGFLAWKNSMYENVKRQRQQKLESVTLYQHNNGAVVPLADQQEEEPQVVSSSVQSNYSSNAETKQVQLNEVKTDYYSNGTSVTTTVTKSKPLDAADWVTVEENTERGEPSQGGWFWRK